MSAAFLMLAGLNLTLIGLLPRIGYGMNWQSVLLEKV